MLTVFARRGFWQVEIVIALVIATIKASLVILFSCTGNTARGAPNWSSCGFFLAGYHAGSNLADYSTRHAEPSRTQLSNPRLPPDSLLELNRNAPFCLFGFVR